MGAQDKVPEAFSKRHKVISLSEGGQTITITRWSIAKTMIMSGWLSRVIKDAVGFDVKQIEGLTSIELGAKMVEVLGDKIIEFLGLAVDPVDKGMIAELPADDALEIFQAIIDLNVTDKLIKKVTELSGLFRSRFPASVKITSSK